MAVADYFQGYVTRAAARAQALAPGRTRTLLMHLLDLRSPQALHVALRAEATLSSGDILTAATQTGTFLDVALHDAVDRTLRLDPERPCVDWVKGQLIRPAVRLSREDVEAFLETLGNSFPTPDADDRAALTALARHWDSKMRFMTGYRWNRYLLVFALAEVGGNRELADSWRALWEALDQPSRTSGLRPAEFRNLIVHSIPRQEEIHKARQVFVDRGLWKLLRKAPDRAESFLEGKHPARVLAAFGVGEAPALFRELIGGLTADIETCRLF